MRFFGRLFLVGLQKEFSLQPSIIIAASGSAANACYFASGQYAEIERIWKSRLASRKFFSPLRFWKVVDIDYLVDEIFKKLEPLDTARLVDSR